MKNYFLSIGCILILMSTVSAEPNSFWIYNQNYSGYCFGINAEKITNDDYREIIIASPIWSGGSIYYHNNGSGGFSVPYTEFSSDGCMYEIKLGQLLPLSPRKELALCGYGYGSGVQIYKHINYSLCLHQTLYLQNVFFRWCDWGRFDNNIYEDLVCSGCNNNAYIFKNISGNLTSQPYLTVNVGGILTLVKLEELDNIYEDGFDDLLCVIDHQIKIFHNEGESFTEVQTITVGANQAHPIIDFEVGDLDGDGYNDLICGIGLYIKVYENLGDGTFDDLPGHYQNFYYPHNQIALGELNYDGHPDLAIINDWEAKIFECTGSVSFETVCGWQGNDFADDQVCLEFADLHGRGAQSLITSYLNDDPEYSQWTYYCFVPLLTII